MSLSKHFRFLTIFITVVLFAVSLGGCGVSIDEESEQESEAQAYQERLDRCREQIEMITDFKPDIVLVLGSGLGDYVDQMTVKVTIPYEEIPGWPVSTAPNHAGKLLFANYKGMNVAVMQGRVHYYEGYSMEDVVLPIRVLHMLGADTAILTNAVGSLNPDFKVGDFVCVRDHITSFVPSPLIGENISELGERFPEMTNVYDQELQDIVLKVGEDNNIPVHSGVYLQVTGPQYETPAENNMYRSFGADTISMSLGVEAIAAAQMNMRVCGINCVSAMGAGIEEEGFTQETVDANMKQISQDFRVLANGLLDELAKKY